jgi:RHS repeat-associated protein
MTNHLGNVLTVIHDIKIPLNNGTDPAVSSYRVGIRNTTDYSPFGVELDGRTVSLEGYRFGYQGSEKDNEFKGQGNSYTTEFRQLDPRLGRWLTIDPLFAKFPWQSSYTSFDNNPILLIDHLGTETESGPGDGYTKNKDGTRSKTNANGTKTYDAPGFSSVTLPANAKVIGTMQDVDGKIDGAIHNNGVRYQATVGDLARFEINNVEYIAQFSSGTFIDFENDKGEKYYFSENKITNTIRQGDPLEFESYGNPKNGTIKIQQADAVGYQLEVGFAFVGGMSIYSGVIQDYTGKKLYYKGYSGNIGFGYGAGVNGFIVKSNTSNRFTVDEWLGNGEGFSGGFGPLSGGFGGTDGPDKYNVYSFGIAKGSANFWWAGTRTSSW